MMGSVFKEIFKFVVIEDTNDRERYLSRLLERHS